MATNATDYLESAMGDHVLNGVTFTTPATSGVVYVALFSGAVSDLLTTGGVTEGELDGFAYARVAVTSGWTESPTGTFTNTTHVEFAAASGGAWNTASGVAIFDALTAGNALVYGTLSGARTILDGDVAIFNPGSISVQWD